MGSNYSCLVLPYTGVVSLYQFTFFRQLCLQLLHKSKSKENIWAPVKGGNLCILQWIFISVYAKIYFFYITDWCGSGQIAPAPYTVGKQDSLSLQDHVLIELSQTGLGKKSKRDADVLIKEDDPFLVVHPNYVLDWYWQKRTLWNTSWTVEKL